MAGMRLLVLGGTAWLGGRITTTALAGGHHVTCLARGESGAVPKGAVHVRADRERPDAHEQVAGARWDAVVDVSRQPGQVRCAAQALAERTETFVFISSASVYADHGTSGQDEGAELLPALDGDVMESMETYGEAKVACERHVLAAYGPERSLVVRAGLVGGPGDVSDRSGYWPVRFARPATYDGSVLVPAVPEAAAQVIDVRDLAAWVVDAAERRVRGTYNAVGASIALSEHLRVAREAAAHCGPLVTVDQDWLLAHDVEPWMGDRSLPLWLPLPEYAGFSARDGGAARAAGLSTRPLSETLADTLAWELAREPGHVRRAGLREEDERALIRAARGGA